jgi:hypothetical protein
MMKTIGTITSVLLLCGCAHIEIRRNVVTNLDGWSRSEENYSPTVEVGIDADGSACAPKAVLDTFRSRTIRQNAYHEARKKNPNEPFPEIPESELKSLLATNDIGPTTSIERIRWQIHPNAPLKKVARLTAELSEIERSEFWTSQGIFIVAAPNYGGRRLPWLHQTNVDYRVRKNRIMKNGRPWATAKSLKDSARKIFADLENQSDLGFVNLYFDFPSPSTWSQMEDVFGTVLPQLDDMRGLYIGEATSLQLDRMHGVEGTVVLHLHDVWKKGWRPAGLGTYGKSKGSSKGSRLHNSQNDNK